MSEQLQIAEISGGIRRAPSRVFPPNGLKKAENIIASINDSIFETAPPIDDLVNIGGGNVIKDAIVHYFDEERIFYVYIESGSGNFIIKAYGDTPITLGSVGIPDDAKLETFNGEVLVHKFVIAGGSGSARSIYKEWTYTRIGVETTETDLFDLPSIIDPDVLFANAYANADYDDIPVVLGGSPTKTYNLISGYQLNGFESVVAEEPDRFTIGNAANPVGENIGVLFRPRVPTTASKLVSAVDIYLGETNDQNEPLKSIPFKFVDSIPMDQELLVLKETACVITSGTPSFITVAGKTWANGQWNHFQAKINGSFYTITNSAPDVLQVAENVSGTSFELYSRWWDDGFGYWRISHYLSSDDGEFLIDRTGYALGTSRYCPYANHIEIFKGFVWLADYIDSNGVRRDSRLINNVVNFDGLSTVNIYNDNVYNEFKSPIIGMKAFDDFMIIITNDGIYAMKFVPSKVIGSWAWTIKKISSILIPSYKYITGDGNSVFLFDGELLYSSDGHNVIPVIDTEQQIIVAEQTTVSGINNNDYSLGWNPKNSNLYMIANNVIRFKGGLFIHTLPSALSSQFVGVWKGNPIFFQNEIFKEIKDVSDEEFVTTFDFEMHQTDLGMKEDKYHIHTLLHLYKGTNGVVGIIAYLNGTLQASYVLDNGTSYDEYLDFVVPKSKSRRFTDIYFRILCTSSTGQVEFRLKTLDFEVDPVRRTMIP